MNEKFLHYVFDRTRADRAVRFIETCCILSKGRDAGKPLKLRPWQRHIVEQIFGWVDAHTGIRRYRKVFIFLPRKNGKSHLSAAIALYCLFADGEQGAEVILAANGRDQASIVFNACAGMVRQSPALNKLARPVPSIKRIDVFESSAFLKAVSADAPTAFGLDISTLIYDEIAFAPNSDLYDALTTASGSRQQPLQIFITTAGWDSDGVGFGLYSYSKLVADDPTLDPSFLPIIFELSESDDWTDEKTWHKANPALGDFLNIEELRKEANEAINKPSEQGKFKMLHLNQWVTAAKGWLDRKKWDALTRVEPDPATLKRSPCYIGLDLSSNQDLTACVALWCLPDGQYYVKPWLFCPEDGLRERELKDRAPYSAWVEHEHLTLTPGLTVDYSFIRKRIDLLAAEFDVKAIGFDPWHAHQFISELETSGFTCVKIRQGAESLAEPTKQFETLIVSDKIHHDGNGCMSWMIGNVTVRLDANANPVPDKKRSRHRIDGVAASIFALACAIKMDIQPPPKKVVEFRLTVLG